MQTWNTAAKFCARGVCVCLRMRAHFLSALAPVAPPTHLAKMTRAAKAMYKLRDGPVNAAGRQPREEWAGLPLPTAAAAVCAGFMAPPPRRAAMCLYSGWVWPH